MALKDKGSALDGFAALYDGTGNAESTVVQSITTKCVVDFELVQRCQDAGDRPHKGTPLGLFFELWPFDMLKRILVEQADEFVRQIALQGFEIRGDVYSFRVWGPYTEKVGEVKQWTPEAGNHTIPRHQQRQAVQVFGCRGDEFSFERGCAFLIQGKFTRAAKHGHVGETDGRIYV